MFVRQPCPAEVDVLGIIAQWDRPAVQGRTGCAVICGDQDPKPVDAVAAPNIGCKTGEDFDTVVTGEEAGMDE